MNPAFALSRPFPSPRRALGALGRPVLRGLLGTLRFAGFGAAIVLHGFRPATWRRTVRAAFGREFRAAGVNAVPAVLGAAALVGLILVGEGLYWLQAAGQTELAASVLRTVLVREVAPSMVGLIIAGRSGITALIILGALRADGQLRMLESQGIDPFHLLVVPRTLAMSLSAFCLTQIFIFAALIAGFVAASALGAVQLSLAEFADRIVAGFGPGTFVLVAIKSVTIGFAVGSVCCFDALVASGDPARAVPGGFMRALLAVLLVSGTISAVL